MNYKKKETAVPKTLQFLRQSICDLLLVPTKTPYITCYFPIDSLSPNLIR
jgi:hypothetical protein